MTIGDPFPSSNDLEEAVTLTRTVSYSQLFDHQVRDMKTKTATIKLKEESHIHIDENKNADNNNEKVKEGDVAAGAQHRPIVYRIVRRSQDQGPTQYYEQPRRNSEGPPPVPVGDAQAPRTGLNPRDEERFRTCIVLITSWAFLIISILFLLCYGYQLEWSPETADPIHVFSLDLGVNMLYIMFIIDIFSSIGVILSYKEHVKPFRLRVFWPAIVFLVLNQIHGTVIWLWVWTGEFPRTCARNSYYNGRRCENIGMMMMINPEGKLKLEDCKCDYGSCLPECKGLRQIQNFFWGTYWLYIFRMAVLVIFIPRLNEMICQCKWCCCIDPRDLPTVSPMLGLETVTINNAGQIETTNERTVTFAANGGDTAGGGSHINQHPQHQPQNTDQCHHYNECLHEHEQTRPSHHDRSCPACQEEAEAGSEAADNSCPCACTCRCVEMVDLDKPKATRGATLICCPHHHRQSLNSNADPCQEHTDCCGHIPARSSSPIRVVVMHSKCKVHTDIVKEIKNCKAVKSSNDACK